VATGFYDQSHLTRHFKRLLATTPGRYQQGGAAAVQADQRRTRPPGRDAPKMVGWTTR
jgi:AraC-like DNA-binding protein